MQVSQLEMVVWICENLYSSAIAECRLFFGILAHIFRWVAVMGGLVTGTKKEDALLDLFPSAYIVASLVWPHGR